MLESEIEKKVSDHAKAKNWLSYKFTSPSSKGVPDRIYLKNGIAFFIEFKAKGKKPTKLQRHVIEKIHRQGVDVHIIDSVETGKKVIDSYA